MNGKQCTPWSDAAERGVWSGSILFAQIFRPNTLSKYGISYAAINTHDLAIVIILKVIIVKKNNYDTLFEMNNWATAICIVVN